MQSPAHRTQKHTWMRVGLTACALMLALLVGGCAIGPQISEVQSKPWENVALVVLQGDTLHGTHIKNRKYRDSHSQWTPEDINLTNTLVASVGEPLSDVTGWRVEYSETHSQTLAEAQVEAFGPTEETIMPIGLLHDLQQEGYDGVVVIRPGTESDHLSFTLDREYAGWGLFAARYGRTAGRQVNGVWMVAAADVEFYDVDAGDAVPATLKLRANHDYDSRAFKGFQYRGHWDRYKESDQQRIIEEVTRLVEEEFPKRIGRSRMLAQAQAPIRYGSVVDS